MTAILVFNELSIPAAIADPPLGAQYLRQFSDVLLDRRIRGRRLLVTPREFLSMQVSIGFSIGRWLSTERWNERDRGIATKLLIDRRVDFDHFVQVRNSTDLEMECAYGGRVANGVRVAHSEGGLAVSLPSEHEWDTPSLRFEKTWIEGENVHTAEDRVPHASTSAHLDANLTWLQTTETAPPVDGHDLWDRRVELFPNLDFCASVESQIRILGGNQRRFQLVLRGFSDLQRYCGNWVTDNFDINALSRASGESQSTLQRFGGERTFLCPDGEFRIFEFHLKRNDTRIHFLEHAQTKRILVGYVGDHLRIVTN
ncbi:MAG: hypothetical protein WA192_19700 [Candidatus Acidiferrales bacterium]